jgi:hypothetical protein
MEYQSRDRQEPAWRMPGTSVGADEVAAALLHMGHLNQIEFLCNNPIDSPKELAGHDLADNVWIVCPRMVLDSKAYANMAGKSGAIGPFPCSHCSVPAHVLLQKCASECMSGKTGTQPTVPVVNVPWKDSVPVHRLAAFLYGLDSVSKDAQAWSNTFVMVETAQEAARVLERVHNRHLGTAQQAADSYAVLCGSSSVGICNYVDRIDSKNRNR